MTRAQAAAAAGEEAGSLALVLAAVAIPIVYAPALASPFLEPKLALLTLTGAIGLGAGVLGWAAGGRRRTARRAPWLALGAVLLTSAVSAAITRARGAAGVPYAGEELARWLAMAGVAVAAAGAAGAPEWRARLVAAIQVGAGVVALLGLLQHLQVLPFPLPVISVPGSTFGNRNMGGEAVALAIPFGLAALSSPLREWSAAPGTRPGGRIWIVGAVVVLQLVYVAFTRARGAWVGAALGIAAFAIARRPPVPRRVWLLAAPVALVVALAASIPGRWIPRDANDTKRFQSGTRLVLEAVDPASPVARTRLALWRRTLALWSRHPWVGAGPGTFPVLFPTVAEPNAARDGVMTATKVPGRAHNELLERLAETGLLGAGALLALYAVGLGVGARRRAAAAGPPGSAEGAIAADDVRAASIATIAATLGCGLFAFPLAMPGTAFLFSIAIGVGGADLERLGRPSPPRGSLGVALGTVVAISLVAGAGVLGARGLAASWWAARAERAVALGPKAGADPVAALGRAEVLALPRARYAAALRSGQLAARLGRPDLAEAAATRALALEPFSPHALAVRAGARLALGDLARAADDAEQALSLFADLPAARATLEEVRRRLSVGSP